MNPTLDLKTALDSACSTPSSGIQFDQEHASTAWVTVLKSRIQLIIAWAVEFSSWSGRLKEIFASLSLSWYILMRLDEPLKDIDIRTENIFPICIHGDYCEKTQYFRSQVLYSSTTVNPILDLKTASDSACSTSYQWTQFNRWTQWIRWISVLKSKILLRMAYIVEISSFHGRSIEVFEFFAM